MMKIGIPSVGREIGDRVDDRFGRAMYYIVYDLEDETYEAIENTARNEVSGAGGLAVRLLDKHQVNVALVPEIGPKALQAFRAFDMMAYSYEREQTVMSVVNQYKENKLAKVVQESHGGYHGNHGHGGLHRV
jgi:predicted Fe-Mo cluster-binding NifX family protein